MALFPDPLQHPAQIPHSPRQNLRIAQLRVAIHALPLAMTKRRSALPLAPWPSTAARASLIPHFRRLSRIHDDVPAGTNVPECSCQLSAFPLLAHGHSHRLFVGALFTKLRPRPRIGFPGMELPDVLADCLPGLAFFKRHISLLE